MSYTSNSRYDHPACGRRLSPSVVRALKAQALAAYESGLAIGGPNAEKRGIRRARQVWPWFRGRADVERIRKERARNGTAFDYDAAMFDNS